MIHQGGGLKAKKPASGRLFLFFVPLLKASFQRGLQNKKPFR
jgi:hypothetical protein